MWSLAHLPHSTRSLPILVRWLSRHLCTCYSSVVRASRSSEDAKFAQIRWMQGVVCSAGGAWVISTGSALDWTVWCVARGFARFVGKRPVRLVSAILFWIKISCTWWFHGRCRPHGSYWRLRSVQVLPAGLNVRVVLQGLTRYS